MKIIARAKGTVHLELEGIPVSLLSFPYGHLVPPTPNAELGVRTASAEDLTAMKLSAIAGRGAAKDFWDFHELLAFRGIELSQAIEEVARKFVAQDPGAVVRSLAYFGEADAEPLPLGLDAEHWARIKADFRRWTAML
jgi:predicted nucleotidyltransferase component of viral defense system